MKPIEWQDARSIEWGLRQAVYGMESLLGDFHEIIMG